MYSLIIAIICISIMFAVATYSVVKNRGGKPIKWAIGMFAAWPILAFVVAAKFKCKPMYLNAVFVDVLLVICLVMVTLNTSSAKDERNTAINLHELGQAMITYTKQHDGVIPSTIEDLIPLLRRSPSGGDLPPALRSPYTDAPGVVGYRLLLPKSASGDTGERAIRLDDLPAGACLIEDIYAPPDARIGFYADGSVRSY